MQSVRRSRSVSSIKILCATEYDNGGQMYALYKALNQYTSHTARLITFKNTYLDYQTDIFDPTLNQVDELVDWADFFILGEVLSPRMHTGSILSAIKPNNCIVRAGGSTARAYPQLYMSGHYKGLMKTGALHDVTIASRIFPMAPTVNMFHFDDFPAKKQKDEEAPIKIVFSGTGLKHKAEHSGEFTKAWEVLAKKHGDELQLINIYKTPWKKTLEIKSGCDLTFDQLKIGAYANSAIEGMWYHCPTFCYVSEWCRTVHPDVPVVNIKTAEEIIERVDRYIDNPDEMRTIGDAGHNYVDKVHSADMVVQRWEALIKFVSEEYSNLFAKKVDQKNRGT